MLNEEVLSLPGDNNPVLCADGKLGMLLVYPTKTDGLCGVQVHGEELHRLIPSSHLSASTRGALRENGAPEMPPASAQECPVQFMLAMDWAGRGGPYIGA